MSDTIGSIFKLDYKVDKELIGGLKLQLGSFMIDTSIKNKLRRKSELLILKDGKKKNCKHCAKDATIMYRVQIDTTKKWVFICKSCLNHLKPGNKSYRYGGTWKA